MSMYLQVLFESALSASILPLAGDATLYAMKAFGGYNMQQAVMMAVLGATAGQMSNWIIGRVLLMLHAKERLALSQTKYVAAVKFFHKHLLFLLLLCAIPVAGKLFVLIAGFLGVRARAAFPLVFAGNIGFYLLIFG